MIDTKAMTQVEEMSDEAGKNLLQRIGYGHLGLSRGAVPYVVPIHYAYNRHDLFIFTTEGKKTEIIEENSQVCLQVEEITDDRHWQSVIVTGEAVQLTNEKEIEHAMNFILAENPKLTPALSVRWMDQWVRINVPVVYKITPSEITGRTTVDR
jgi:uncharacterized protein